ncbi:MAG: chromophore lyase CpcT/CpeT [Hyphomonadaceae bacterium]|nr:chromophore lyase CpcT/CpeT [Hyphomonadaceae bacterium]
MHRTRLVVAIVCAALAVCACATPPARPSNAEALAALMEGRFATAPDDPDHAYEGRWVRFDAPALGGVTLYSQLNAGPEPRVYRQRVFVLTDAPDGAVRARAMELVDPARFVDAWTQPERLAALTAADLGEAIDAAEASDCAMIWRRDADEWRGAIGLQQCWLWSERRNAFIMLGAESVLSADRYLQTERGYDANGVQIFGTPPDVFITLHRAQ